MPQVRKTGTRSAKVGRRVLGRRGPRAGGISCALKGAVVTNLELPAGAVIGAGLMGRWHADTIRRMRGRVAAVVDPNPDSARRLAARFPDCAAFTSCGEMLARSAPAVIHVCTPGETHREIAEECMAAGAHLVIEKPLAPAARETEYLLRRAAQRRILMCPVHQYLFQAGVRRAIALLPRIGAPVDVQAVFCSAGGARLPKEALDRVAADILPHPLSLIGRMFPDGLPDSSLVARKKAPGELRVSWDSAATAFSICISMNGRPTCSALRITGTDGTLHLDLFHGYAVFEPGRVSRFRKIVHPFDLGIRTLFAAGSNMAGRIVRWEPAYPGLRTLVQAFYRAVQSGDAPPVSPEETMAVANARDRVLSAAV
jgi:predicted dehydrogenase